MPNDDDVVRVGMEVDSSEYLAGLNKAYADTQKVLGQLEAKYADTMVKIQLSTQTLNTVITSVNKQFGEGAAQLPLFTSYTSKYTEEVVRQTEAAQAFRLEIIATNRELEEQKRLITSTQMSIRQQRAVQSQSSVLYSATPAPPAPAPATPSSQFVPVPSKKEAEEPAHKREEETQEPRPTEILPVGTPKAREEVYRTDAGMAQYKATKARDYEIISTQSEQPEPVSEGQPAKAAPTVPVAAAPPAVVPAPAIASPIAPIPTKQPYELGPPGKTVYYHGTREENLPSIAKTGLDPFKAKAENEEGYTPPITYLTKTRKAAEEYAGEGGTVLSVTPPKSVTQKFDRSEAGQGTFKTSEVIPPEYIQVQGSGAKGSVTPLVPAAQPPAPVGQPKQSYEDYVRASPPPSGETFYHGTSQSNLESIRKTGLDPTKATDLNEASKPMVFMAKDIKTAQEYTPGGKFGVGASESGVGSHEGKPLILEVTPSPELRAKFHDSGKFVQTSEVIPPETLSVVGSGGARLPLVPQPVAPGVPAAPIQVTPSTTQTGKPLPVTLTTPTGSVIPTAVAANVPSQTVTPKAPINEGIDTIPHAQSILDDLKGRLNTGPGTVLAGGMAGANELEQQAVSQTLAQLVKEHGDATQLPKRVGGGNENAVYDIGAGNVVKVRPDQSLAGAKQAFADQEKVEAQLGGYANKSVARSIQPLGEGAVGFEVQPKVTPTVSDRETQRELGQEVWRNTGVAPDVYGAATNFGHDEGGKLKVIDTGAAITDATSKQAAKQFGITEGQLLPPPDPTQVRKVSEQQPFKPVAAPPTPAGYDASESAQIRRMKEAQAKRLSGVQEETPTAAPPPDPVQTRRPPPPPPPPPTPPSGAAPPPPDPRPIRRQSDQPDVGTSTPFFDTTLNKKQMESVASAQSLVQRQAKTLAEIEKDTAASVGMSSQEMAGLYVRATTEMRIAGSALITAQKELGPSAATGSTQATAAIDSLDQSYTKADAVVKSVKSQIAQLSATEKTAVESETGATVATQQHAAALELLARQEQTLNSIQLESKASIGSLAEQQALYRLALTESRIALSALSNAQKTIGPAAASGNAEAIAAIDGFKEAYTNASGVVSALKVQLIELSPTNRAVSQSTDEATLSTNRLVEAQKLAARQVQTLKALQVEATAAVGASSGEMEALYVRAASEMRLASSALASAQKEIGPAAAAGNADAIASLASLQQSFIDASALADGLKSQMTQLGAAEDAAAASTQAESTATAQLAAAQELALRQTTALNGIQKELDSSVKVTAASLSSVYVRATTEARTANTALINAQKLLGPAAAAGNVEAIAAIQLLEKNFQEASSYATLLKEQLSVLASAQNASATSARAHSEAQAVQAQTIRAGAAAAVEEAGAFDKLSYSSYRAMASSRALASEAGLGGVGYAISRVASMSTALGPILEAALPIALVVGITEAIVGMGEAGYKAFENFILIKDSMDEIDKVSIKMGKDVENAFQRGEEAAISHLKHIGEEVDAAKRKVALEEHKPIDLSYDFKTDKEIQKDLGSLTKDQQNEIQHAFTETVPAQLPGKLKEVEDRLVKINAAISQIKAQREDASSSQSVTFSPYGGSAGGGVDLMLQRQENQLNVERKAFDKLRDVVKANIVARGKIAVEEEDQVREAQDKKLIQATEEQIAIMKANGKYTKEAEKEKWEGVLSQVQPKTPEYREVEQKIGTTMGKGPTAKLGESEMRKADQDEITEMRLHASEVGQAQAELLAKEEAFIRSRIIAEKKYVDNVRSLRSELVRVLQEEERDRITMEDKKASTFMTSQGKPDYSAQLDFWNQIATNAQNATNSVNEYNNAITQAQRAGGEAIRQTNDQMKKSVQDQYETWVTSGHHTESEIVKFWEDIKSVYASDGTLVEEAILRIAEATTKLREETERLNALKEERSKIGIEGGFKGQEEAIRGATELNMKIPGVVTPPPPPPTKQEIKMLDTGSSPEVKEDKEIAALHEKEYQEALSSNKREQQIYAQNPEKLQALLNKEQQLTSQHDQKVLQDSIKLTKDLEKNWDAFFAKFNEGFASGIAKALTHQQSFGKSMSQLYNQLVLMAVSYEAKKYLLELEGYLKSLIFVAQHKVVQSAADKVRQTSAQTTNAGILGSAIFTDAAITTSDAAVVKARIAGDVLSATSAKAAGAETLATTLPKNVAMATSYVGVAAAEAAAAVAGIPIVGPGLAAAAASAMLAKGAPLIVMAGFEQGGIVPNTGIAMVHGGEMVLPAQISQQVQKSAVAPSTVNNINNQAPNQDSGLDNGLLKQIATNTLATAKAVGGVPNSKGQQQQQAQQNMGIGGEIKAGLKQDFMNAIGLPNRDLNNLTIQQLLAKIADNTSVLKPGMLSKGLGVGLGALFGFKQGGLVPGPSDMAVPAVLHGKEMVLPEHLSTGVQSIINNGGDKTTSSSRNSNSFNLNYSPNHGGSGNPTKDSRDMIKEVRRMSRTFNR